MLTNHDINENAIMEVAHLRQSLCQKKTTACALLLLFSLVQKGCILDNMSLGVDLSEKASDLTYPNLHGP